MNCETCGLPLYVWKDVRGAVRVVHAGPRSGLDHAPVAPPADLEPAEPPAEPPEPEPVFVNAGS